MHRNAKAASVFHGTLREEVVLTVDNQEDVIARDGVEGEGLELGTRGLQQIRVFYEKILVHIRKRERRVVFV